MCLRNSAYWQKFGLAAAVWRDSLPDLHVGAVDLLLSDPWVLGVARASSYLR
jgi:hypothetical protein